jgi:hypothetical protein
MPMKSALSDLFGHTIMEFGEGFFGFVLSWLSTYFVGCFIVYLWNQRSTRSILFLGLSALVGFASNMKITHQFSSRYVFVFLPLLLLSLAPAIRSTWHLPIRVAFGACIGLASIGSYLLLPTQH